MAEASKKMGTFAKAPLSTQRDFHITVFGASGFTGKYVAEELHRIKQEKGNEQLRWAMAGRNLKQLKETAKG